MSDPDLILAISNLISAAKANKETDIKKYVTELVNLYDKNSTHEYKRVKKEKHPDEHYY